jgi:hypothetical protein
MTIDDPELASRREARIAQRRLANAALAADLKKTLGIVDP